MLNFTVGPVMSSKEVCDIDFDVMIEAKQKDLALEKLMKELKELKDLFSDSYVCKL